jgi:hypothetical protein
MNSHFIDLGVEALDIVGQGFALPRVAVCDPIEHRRLEMRVSA